MCLYTAGRFLFHDLGLSDTTVGVVLLVGSMAMLCACLLLIVKLLNSSLRGRVVTAARTVINAELPGRASVLTGYLAMPQRRPLTARDTERQRERDRGIETDREAEAPAWPGTWLC